MTYKDTIDIRFVFCFILVITYILFELHTSQCMYEKEIIRLQVSLHYRKTGFIQHVQIYFEAPPDTSLDGIGYVP